jgi:N-acetylmuramoyl-L-alanine amidase
VLVECGFLSNKAELEKLKDKDYQNKMAFSIYCGILEYFKGEK